MKILQICGRAPNSRQVPPDIPGAERWIIGSAYHEHVGTAYTRVFDVHQFAFIAKQRPEAWRWYAEQDRPVYLIDVHPDVPVGLAYPLPFLQQHFGLRGSCAFSSTVDHMMALAIYEGFTEIHLCGVRLNSIEEWVLQRECLAYWIGLAEGRGITVETDPEAALCTPERVYGYDYPTGARRAPGQPMLVYGRPGDEMVPV